MKTIKLKEIIIRFDSADYIATYQVFEDGKLLFSHRSISIKSIVSISNNTINLGEYKKFIEERENEL